MSKDELHENIKKHRRFRIPITTVWYTQCTLHTHNECKQEKARIIRDKKKSTHTPNEENNYFHATWRRIVRMPCMSTYFHDLNGFLYSCIRLSCCAFFLLLISPKLNHIFLVHSFCFHLFLYWHLHTHTHTNTKIKQKNDERQQWQDKIMFYL